MAVAFIVNGTVSKLKMSIISLKSRERDEFCAYIRWMGGGEAET